MSNINRKQIKVHGGHLVYQTKTLSLENRCIVKHQSIFLSLVKTIIFLFFKLTTVYFNKFAFN